MIHWSAPDTVEISLSVAAALLAFASKDDTRAHLGVGVADNALCATDGHRLVLFPFDTHTTANQDTKPSPFLEGHVWARSHVETALRVARATKSDRVVLRSVDMLPAEVRFPPVWQVVPGYGMEPESETDAYGVDPAYLADLKLVAKACDCKGVKLTQLKGDLDPLGFAASGREHDARAVIMPMRI